MFLLVLAWTIALFGAYEYIYLMNIKSGKPHRHHSHSKFQAVRENVQIRDGYRVTGVEGHDALPQYFTRSGRSSGVRRRHYAVHGETGQSIVTNIMPEVGTHMHPKAHAFG